MSRRLHRGLLVALAASLLPPACTTFVQVPVDEALARREVEVRFPTPRTVTGRSRTGENVTLQGVRRLVGHPVAVRGDTLVMDVRRWSESGAWKWPASPVVTTIATHWSTPVGNQRFSFERTVTLIVATPVVALLVLIVWCANVDCYREGT